jgi:hypothetical protein
MIEKYAIKSQIRFQASIFGLDQKLVQELDGLLGGGGLHHHAVHVLVGVAGGRADRRIERMVGRGHRINQTHRLVLQLGAQLQQRLTHEQHGSLVAKISALVERHLVLVQKEQRAQVEQSMQNPRQTRVGVPVNLGYESTDHVSLQNQIN